ncbi:MAG: DUF167 domain-containing protein [Deltaproteobacteria bacterium]|nr:DUF167 domain-containing protein [Deltaproteobacteria bacterium]
MARRIWVAVKPQARKDEVVRLAAGEYRVSVHAPAKGGKANEAVIELLANHFSVTKSAIRMVLGQSARRKLIEIS